MEDTDVSGACQAAIKKDEERSAQGNVLRRLIKKDEERSAQGNATRGWRGMVRGVMIAG